MLYALLIYQSEGMRNRYSEEEMEAMMAGHRALQIASKAAGHFVEANQLQPAEAATTVRIKEGELIVTDGPFIETKEMLIGLYVFDCDDLEQAVEYARAIPHSQAGAIEIRPIVYFENSR